MPRFFASSLALLLFFAGSAATEPARVPVELVDDAVLAVLEQLPQDGEREGPLSIEQPGRIRAELGAVIDASPADGGAPRVVAVTPGRAAARMGMQVGDRLLEVNGVGLQGSDAGARLRAALDDLDRPLAFSVQRGGQTLDLRGHADRVSLPGYRLEIAAPEARGCGRISVAVKPPISQQLYPALLHEIDGRLPGALDAQVFRVRPGRQVLKVSELIDPNRFTGRENQQRSQLFRHERFKYLEIDVRPNTSYRLAVRFHDDRRQPVRDQAYWEPVIWQEVEETCR